MMLTSSARVPSAHCGANTATLKNGVPNGTLDASTTAAIQLEDADERDDERDEIERAAAPATA